MKILVTGANGFLGAWVCRRLIDEGHEVLALVRPNSQLDEISKLKVAFVHGDVTDLESLMSALGKGVQAVFHLAGVVGYTAKMRALMEAVNVQGTANVLAACKSRGITDLVFVSSVVAIGAGFTPQQILSEKSAYNVGAFNFGYFETKRKAEELVVAAFHRGEVRPIIVNPSTIYGAGDARKGSRKTQVLVAQGKMKFYPPGGASVVAVEDLVDGMMSAWTKGRPAERYILSGQNLLLKEIFAIIAEVAGARAPFIPIPQWAILGLGHLGDLLTKFNQPSPLSYENAKVACMYHWFDASKAKQELGFSPRSGREAITASVQWMLKNGYVKK